MAVRRAHPGIADVSRPMPALAIAQSTAIDPTDGTTTLGASMSPSPAASPLAAWVSAGGIMKAFLGLGIPVSLYALGVAVAERQLEVGAGLDPATALQLAPLLPKSTTIADALQLVFAPSALFSTGEVLVIAWIAWGILPWFGRTRLFQRIKQALGFRYIFFVTEHQRVALALHRIVLVVLGLALTVLGLLLLAIFGAEVALGLGVLPGTPSIPWPARSGLVVCNVLSMLLLYLPSYQTVPLVASWSWLRTHVLPQHWLWATVLCYVGSLCSAYASAPIGQTLLSPITLTTTGGTTLRGTLIAHADGYWNVLVDSHHRGYVQVVRDNQEVSVIRGDHP